MTTTVGQFRQTQEHEHAEQEKQARIVRSAAPLRAAVDAVQSVFGRQVAEAISRERWARWIAETRLARAENRIDRLTMELIRAGIIPEQPAERFLGGQDDPEWSQREHIL